MRRGRTDADPSLLLMLLQEILVLYCGFTHTGNKLCTPCTDGVSALSIFSPFPLLDKSHYTGKKSYVCVCVFVCVGKYKYIYI